MASRSDPALFPEELKGRGQKRAVSQANGQWVAAFDRALLERAREKGTFTSEDITKEVGEPELAGSPSNNAIGARISWAAKKGIIVLAGYEVARRPSRHGGLIRRWAGGPGAWNTR